MSVLLKALQLLPRDLRHRLIRNQARIDERELAGIEVTVASTVEAYVDAARLVHDGYVARGLATAHGSGVRVTPFLALPTTIVFTARHAGKMVGTLSLVVDSSLGVPLERIYSDEVNAVRAGGRRVAEVGSLCVAPGYRGVGVTYLLNKAMKRCAVELLGVDDLLIAVHPDAVDLYEATLCFERIGQTKQYPGLNRSALAVALRLRLDAVAERTRALFGSEPTLCNPHHLYCVRVDPQIHLPTPATLQAVAKVHRSATVKLAALRPDMVTELCERDFQNLRGELGQAT